MLKKTAIDVVRALRRLATRQRARALSEIKALRRNVLWAFDPETRVLQTYSPRLKTVYRSIPEAHKYPLKEVRRYRDMMYQSQVPEEASPFVKELAGRLALLHEMQEAKALRRFGRKYSLSDLIPDDPLINVDTHLHPSVLESEILWFRRLKKQHPEAARELMNQIFSARKRTFRVLADIKKINDFVQMQKQLRRPLPEMIPGKFSTKRIYQWFRNETPQAEHLRRNIDLIDRWLDTYWRWFKTYYGL